jgi:hypothetical protein
MTFSKPWTQTLNLRNDPTIPTYSNTRVTEGNYAMRNILSGARAAEKK